MSEYRIKKLKECLNKYDLNHILITDMTSAEYISGFRSSNTFLLISYRKNILCTDFRYRETALQFCRNNRKWHFVEIRGGNYSFLQELVKEKDRIGIQSDIITLDQFDKIKKQLKK